MKVKYILHMALINLSRRKARAAISILLMTFALTILTITLALSSSITGYFDKNAANNAEYRTLFVEYDYQSYSEAQILDRISEFKHIAAVIPQRILSEILTLTEFENKVKVSGEGNNDGKVMAKGANKYTVPYITRGRNFKEGETNVAIIPEKLLPDSRIEVLKGRIDKDGFIDGKSLIGKTLTGKSHNDYTYTFTVIGVYDAAESLEKENTCFIPYLDIDKMYKASNPDKPDEIGYPVVVVVDNYKNMQSVIDELFRNGLQGSVRVSVNTDLPIYINTVGGMLSITVFIVALINIALTTVSTVKDRTQEIGLLKAIGYNDKVVLSILNVETIMLGFIGLVLSTLLSTGILEFLTRLNNAPGSNNIQMQLRPNLVDILLAFAVSIAVPAVACIFSSIKIIRIQLSSAMKE
jgi:ABC-type antimicrobial peptide transport system permease subunit